ncbi:MAG: hypothetical protein GMKNLPBB_02000 [Myxococcota bacterium]|nr:hypothetical protein [Myxococcota bacterium]
MCVVAKPASRDMKHVTVEMKPGFTMPGVRVLLEQHGVKFASDAIHGVRSKFVFKGRGPFEAPHGEPAQPEQLEPQ